MDARPCTHDGYVNRYDWLRYGDTYLPTSDTYRLSGSTFLLEIDVHCDWTCSWTSLVMIKECDDIMRLCRCVIVGQG
jgi:hypothetical protein